MMAWHEVSGWLGTVMVLFAYYKANRNQWEPEHANAKITNLLGCALMGVNACMTGAWPLLAFEVSWFCITAGTWVVDLRGRHNHRDAPESQLPR